VTLCTIKQLLVEWSMEPAHRYVTLVEWSMEPAHRYVTLVEWSMELARLMSQ